MEKMPVLKEKPKSIILELYESEELLKILGKSLEETFANEDSKREFISKLDYEEFKDLLIQLNGIVRAIPVDERKIDGADVIVGNDFFGIDYMPPAEEEKLILLSELLGSVQRMNNKNRELKDIALLISSVINATHLFNDGNGRLSRMFYLFLTKNLEKDKLKKY